MQVQSVTTATPSKDYAKRGEENLLCHIEHHSIDKYLLV